MTQTIITAGDSSALLAFQGGDDGTLVLKTGAAGSKVNALSFAADGTPTFLKVPVNAAVQSMVRLNTTNGYGSTNTRIRRFTNVVTNQGSDITYADSATLGATFTINSNGVYSINYTDSFSTGEFLGVSLNSSQLTTVIYSIAIGDVLAMSATASVNDPYSCTWVGYLPSGSIVRAHCGAGTTGVAARGLFTITRVA
jgi:hypothetical protein